MTDSFEELERLLLARVIRQLTEKEEGILFDAATLQAADAATDALRDTQCHRYQVVNALSRFASASRTNCDRGYDGAYYGPEEADRIDAARELLAKMAAAMSDVARTLDANAAKLFVRHLRDFENAADAICELCEELTPSF